MGQLAPALLAIAKRLGKRLVVEWLSAALYEANPQLADRDTRWPLGKRLVEEEEAPAKRHLIAEIVPPVGTPAQRASWAVDLLQRQPASGNTQADTAQEMADACLQQFGRQLQPRLPTLSYRLSVEELEEDLGKGWPELLDGGQAAAAAVHGRPIEEVSRVVAALLEGRIIADAHLQLLRGTVRYDHGCQLSDAGWALAAPRLLHMLGESWLYIQLVPWPASRRRPAMLAATFRVAFDDRHGQLGGLHSHLGGGAGGKTHTFDDQQASMMETDVLTTDAARAAFLWEVLACDGSLYVHRASPGHGNAYLMLTLIHSKNPSMARLVKRVADGLLQAQGLPPTRLSSYSKTNSSGAEYTMYKVTCDGRYAAARLLTRMASLALPSLPPWLQRQAQRLQQAGEPEAHKAARALLPSRKLGALQHATSSGAAVFGSQIPVITVELEPPDQEPYTLFVLHMSASGQPGEEEETWVLEPQGRRLLCMDTNVNVMKGKGYTSTDSITVIKAEAAGRLQRALEAVVAAGYPDKSIAQVNLVKLSAVLATMLPGPLQGRLNEMKLAQTSYAAMAKEALWQARYAEAVVPRIYAALAAEGVHLNMLALYRSGGMQMMRLMDAAAGIQRLGPGQPAVLQSARAVPVSELLGRLQRVTGIEAETGKTGMVLLLSCAVLAVPTPGKWDPKLQTKPVRVRMLLARGEQRHSGRVQLTWTDYTAAAAKTTNPTPATEAHAVNVTKAWTLTVAPAQSASRPVATAGGTPTPAGLQLLARVDAAPGAVAALLADAPGVRVFKPAERTAGQFLDLQQRLTASGKAYLTENTTGVVLAAVRLKGRPSFLGASGAFTHHWLHAEVLEIYAPPTLLPPELVGQHVLVPAHTGVVQLREPGETIPALLEAAAGTGPRAELARLVAAGLGLLTGEAAAAAEADEEELAAAAAGEQQPGAAAAGEAEAEGLAAEQAAAVVPGAVAQALEAVAEGDAVGVLPPTAELARQEAATISRQLVRAVPTGGEVSQPAAAATAAAAASPSQAAPLSQVGQVGGSPGPATAGLRTPPGQVLPSAPAMGSAVAVPPAPLPPYLAARWLAGGEAAAGAAAEAAAGAVEAGAAEAAAQAAAVTEPLSEAELSELGRALLLGEPDAVEQQGAVEQAEQGEGQAEQQEGQQME